MRASSRLSSSSRTLFRCVSATLAVLLLAVTAGQAQTSLTDAAGPRVIVPAQTTPQFLVLNSDASLQGYAAASTSNYTLNCGTPQGLSVAAGTSLTLAVDDRNLTTFQTGSSSQGPAVVGRSTPSNGTNCVNSPSVLIGGSPVTALLSTQDHFHQRLYVVSQGSGSSADTITSFNTANVVFNKSSETLTQAGQGTLDTGGTYTSVAADVDGTYGDTIVTELRTSTSAGGTWLFNSTTGMAVRILGPGGVALPAIAAFILHNPDNGGGGLLVLANQDGLTSANLASPPTDTTPFSIIDLGQLDTLMAYNSSATSVTLPSIKTIGSSLGYYAMLGAAYNPVTGLLYAVVGGGTSTTSVTRQIVSYDPSKPSAPAETVVADVSAAQLTGAANTQVALNAASGTMQILGKDTNTVYTAAITGTGNTGTQVVGSTFADTNFVPTYIASNPLLGETYIASKSQVDIITKPAASKIQLTLDLTGPETQAAVGDYSASLLVTSPNPVDFGLSSTSVTVTATPQGGTPYTFGSTTAAYGTGSATTIHGSFPTAGIYTLVASFPGDTVTAASTSSPVVVAVGQALFATQTLVTGTFNSSTGSGKATVSLTGTTYTPSGTITLTSVNTGTTLVTYTLQAQSFSNPITFAFTAPPSTTQVKATYSGDALNQASASAATTLTASQGTVTPKLVLTLPSTGATNAKVHLNVAFTSTSTATPTGTIVVAAATSSTAFMTIASIPAAQAIAAGGAGYDWTPTVAGQYLFTLYYDGDSNYGQASVSNAGSITITGTVTPVSVTLLAPSTATQGTTFSLGVLLSPTGATPTGDITVTAVKSDSSTLTLGTVTAAAAATTAGATLPVTFATTGVYTLNGNYAGDSNYAAATSSNLPTITVSGGTLPAALLTPASATFAAAVGTSSAYQNFTLYNTGGAALTVGAITVSNSAFAQINGCPASLAAGANCVVRVQFVPTVTGSATGALIVNTNDANSPARAALSGSATGGAITLTPTSFSFNDQTVGTSSFVRPILVLHNTGTSALTVTGVNVSNLTDFDLLGTGCAVGTVVPASMSCTVQLYFHPSTAATKTGTVTFTTSNSASVSTTVSGLGLAAGACMDTDGDGLCDDWEQNGVWVRVPGKADRFIDLPSMGATYDHKDIFIQADYMGTVAQTDNEHSHQMTLGAQAIDIASFNNAPVPNVDGTFGIHIHIDCGFYCIMDPVKNTTWGNASQATEIVEQTSLDPLPFSATVPFDWTTFDSDSAGFLASGRSLVFHHALFAHNQNPLYYSSGISRNANGTAFNKGASDLIVSMGGWTGMVGTDLEQAGTLMHELGHNLALHHGGNEDYNYKTNYLSVMNYNYQTVGLIVNGVSGTFDYSRFKLPAFDEGTLSEAKGLQYSATDYPGSGSTGFPDITKYGVFWFCPGAVAGKSNPVGVQYVNGKINWDCDVKKTISQTPVEVDTNADGAYDYYYSFNDWPALVFSGGAVGGNGIGVPLLMQTPSGEITMQEASLNVQDYAVAVTGMGGVHTAPGSSPTLRFNITNKGRNADVYALSPGLLGGWTLAAGTPATATVAAGATAEVALTYTVPTTASEGASNVLLLSVVSQATPNIHDSRQVNVYATATPGPVAFSLSTVIFGAQNVGVSGVPNSVVVINTGTSALAVGAILASSEFTQTNTCGTSLAVGASCSVSVTFTPAAAGTRTGTLTINTGAGMESVALTGTAVVADLPLPQVVLTSTPTATSTGQSVTLTSNVASFPAGMTPTGTVTFLNGTTQLGQATLDASGNATFTSTTLGAGTYNLIAQYSGDTAFRSANSAFGSLVIATATPTTITLASSAAAVASGTSVTFTATVGGGASGSAQPSGSVRFLDGTAVIGAGALNVNGVATLTTSAVTTAMHTITAVYGGDTTFAASTSAALQEAVGLFTTTTALSTTASPVVTGASVTLTATVTATSGTPGGLVTFVDGSTTLGTGTLNAGGVATYSTSTLAIGTHTIVAMYAAAGNFAASVSAAKQVVVTGLPDYSVAASPATLTVTSGSTATATFTVTPVNGYSNSVSFSCGSLPSYATCTFSPAKLTFAATAQTAQATTLTFSTTQGQASLKPLWRDGRGLTLALLLPLALFGLGRKRRRPALVVGLVMLVVSAAGFLALSGCAGGSPQATPSTPVGTYSVPVTITDGTTAHSVTYSVTVK